MHYVNLTFLTCGRNTDVMCMHGAYTHRQYTWTLSQPTVRVDHRDVPSMLATGLVREV